MKISYQHRVSDDFSIVWTWNFDHMHHCQQDVLRDISTLASQVCAYATGTKVEGSSWWIWKSLGISSSRWSYRWYSYTYPKATIITIRLLQLERILLRYNAGRSEFSWVLFWRQHRMAREGTWCKSSSKFFLLLQGKRRSTPSWLKKNLNVVDVPLLILGDPAYPLLPWLMKAYPENGGLTPKQQHFNYRLSRARMVVGNAFGRLKGRWRCLLKRMDYYEVDHILHVVASCVVLHNFCKLHGDPCDPRWIHHQCT